MKKEGKYLYRRFCAAFLILLASAMFLFIWLRFVKVNNQTGHLTGIGNLGMAVGIYVVSFLLFGHLLHAFRIGVERKATLLAAMALNCVLTNILELFISLAITGQFRFFPQFLWRYVVLAAAQMLILCLLLIPMTDLYRRIFPPLQILEIYGEFGQGLMDKINDVPYKYHVAELVHYRIPEEELRRKMQQYDAVLINDIPSQEKNNILKMCVDEDKRVYLVPKISDVVVRYTEPLNLFDTPLFLCRNSGMSKTEAAIKRFFDVVLSILALVVLSPVFLVTGIAIKLEDKGPVFFRQERVTIGHKRFQILKFRSMIVNAEEDGKSHPAQAKDDRITKVGRVIRAVRIDELPQLINIIKGDMSIVGPRPERVEHVELYEKEIPEFSFRYKVKGGLTGYAQVYGKYNTTALDKLKLDLMYIMNYNLLLDVQILFETVKILFQKESTEGFDQKKAQEIHDNK
ncbi:MAG: sugar transferase [Clostridia bacterium]|nr:sugar transferase [Clostridia bacterium]